MNTQQATPEIAPHRWPGLCWPHVRRELARELEVHRRVYPGWINEARIEERSEADRQIALFEALVADAERTIAGKWSEPPAHPHSRQARTDALIRELDLRRRVYPRHVETAKLAQVDADHRIACLEAMLWHFDNGFDWTPANGISPAFGRVDPTPEQEATREELRSLAATIAARWHGETQQQALAL